VIHDVTAEDDKKKGKKKKRKGKKSMLRVQKLAIILCVVCICFCIRIISCWFMLIIIFDILCGGSDKNMLIQFIYVRVPKFCCNP